MDGLLKLAGQSVLELAAVGWAGWELWKLRTPKQKPPSAEPPSSHAPRHAVGEHPLDDGRP